MLEAAKKHTPTTIFLGPSDVASFEADGRTTHDISRSRKTFFVFCRFRVARCCRGSHPAATGIIYCSRACPRFLCLFFVRTFVRSTTPLS